MSRPYGSTHPFARLTEEDVREMRQFRTALGMKVTEIADLFGVSKGTASKAISGKAWKHVDADVADS